MKRVLITIALSLASAIVLAIPKPSEVKAAFAAGDYQRAEALLNEVMKERPTATVHYQLGQVYAKEGKHSAALNEFRQAQTLDPSLKFASSAAAFMKNLSDEQAIVAPPPPRPLRRPLRCGRLGASCGFASPGAAALPATGMFEAKRTICFGGASRPGFCSCGFAGAASLLCLGGRGGLPLCCPRFGLSSRRRGDSARSVRLSGSTGPGGAP